MTFSEFKDWYYTWRYGKLATEDFQIIDFDFNRWQSGDFTEVVAGSILKPVKKLTYFSESDDLTERLVGVRDGYLCIWGESGQCFTDELDEMDLKLKITSK